MEKDKKGKGTGLVTEQVAAGTWGSPDGGAGEGAPGGGCGKGAAQGCQGSGIRGARPCAPGGWIYGPLGTPICHGAGAAALTPARVKMNFHSAQFAFRLH